jgi:hypothetical protein
MIETAFRSDAPRQPQRAVRVIHTLEIDVTGLEKIETR